MVLNYGTSGFRCDSEKLINYSEKIGEALVNLMDKSRNIKGFLSIIITASHNPENDNGIKIINNQGKMINTNQSKYLEYYINNKNENEKIFVKNKFKIIIGKDTRKSGEKIINLIIKGIKNVSNCNIIHAGYVTTPIIHYLAKNHKNIHNQKNIQNFIDKYTYQIINKSITSTPYIDCSGGVASKILKKINNNFKVICKYGENILNHNCGSDYLMTNKKLPDILNNKNNIYGCSLDGDADRSVFWMKNKNKLFILDGDHQLVLWCLFLKKKNINSVAVTTSYCNGAVMNLLKKENIDIKITATGMKNLIEEADKHKNVVYFENNGHGTMNIEKEIILKNGETLLYNNLIGDGIYNVLTTFQILEDLDMNMEDWYNLYKKIPSFQFKIPSDKLPPLKMNNIGNRVIEPEHIQKKLDNISKEYQGRVFLRPSGTEPVIRFYCESEKNLEKMVKHICEIFKI